MQKSQFISSSKGMAFSVDALVSVALIASAFFLFSSMQYNSFPSGSAMVKAEDTLFSLENTGFLIETIDTNSNTQAAILIREKILDSLPNNFDANISVTSYIIDAEQCALHQDFENCFPDQNKVTGVAGGNAENNYVQGKKYFLRKQPPGDCNISYLEFSPQIAEGIEWEAEREIGGALFQEIFFDEGDVNVTFDVNVTPSDLIVCDQDVNITLSVTVPENVRKAIDLALVLDRSGSMSWTGRVDTQDARGLYVDGNYLFLADNTADVKSFDISDPRLPTFLDMASTPNITAYDIHGEGDYIFAVNYYYHFWWGLSGDLVAYNKSDPSNIYYTDILEFDDGADSVFTHNDYVYVIGDRGSGYDWGMYVVDATNKSNMQFNDYLILSGAEKVFVEGTTAFVARGANGMTSVDVSNPNSLQILDTIDVGGSAKDVFVNGNYAYLANGDAGLTIFNISNPSNIVELDSYNTPNYALAVYVEDGIAYIADDSSLQILDVSDPNSITFINSFASDYDYVDVFYRDGFAFLAASSMGLFSINATEGPRMNNAKESAKMFVDYNGWTMPPDQMAVVGFNTSSILYQELTSGQSELNDAIDLIVSSGGTDIESGIDRATTELISGRANPNALKFQVVLSDGQSNEGDSAIAAQDADDQGIIIFTIGFGADADEQELETIATITGGEYYSAQDENALKEVFDLIALKVEELANDSNVSVPIFDGTGIVDLGGGVLVDGNLVFDAGTITVETPFTTTYTLNFSCSNEDICGIDALTFPGPGTTFTWVDSEGIPHTIDFNASETLTFKSRDLNVGIQSGTLIGPNDISLDVLVENTGELDAEETTLRYYLNDTNGPLLGEETVPALCSITTPGCTNNTFYTTADIAQEGVIYSVINDSNTISECPIGNVDAVHCYGGPATQVIVVGYTIWRKT